MNKEEKIVFLKNPRAVLEQTIRKFVRESEANRRVPFDGGVYWDEPLIGFASGTDPLFDRYKSLIGSFHQTPAEIIAAALKEKGRELLPSEAEEISVIVWVLPASQDIRESNRREKRFPSKLWSLARHHGELFNNALRNHVTTFLEELGYVARAPFLLPSFQTIRDEKVGLASTWSERHAAYACGLGTFSLNDGFITARGMAMRVGSVVTLLKLPPSERAFRDHRENCLFFRNEKCGRCIYRCPAGAITEQGHDKDKCMAYIRSEPLVLHRTAFGVPGGATGCGLCQTGVPCEAQVPQPDLVA
jgi:epoxyqueuosine reductase